MADHATSPTTPPEPRAGADDGAGSLLALVRALARAAARDAFRMASADRACASTEKAEHADR